MNILLINHYAGSIEMGMEFRPYYLAKEWKKLGHTVYIIAGDYSHLRINNPTVENDFQQEEIDGINYIWFKTGYYEGNGVKRAMTMARFVGKLIFNANKIVSAVKPDVVIASSTYPLDTYAAQLIAKKSKARLIHEVHDMWPSTLTEIGGMSKTNPFVVVMQIAENSAYKHSDYVVALPAMARPYMEKHGLKKGRFVNIRNGVVLEDWENPASLPEEHFQKLSELKKDNFIVGYFGGHALSNALDTLLDSAKELTGSGIHIVLVGDGVEKPRLMERAKAENIENVTFLPPVPKKDVPSLVSFFDCSYVGSLDSPLYRFGICMNKIFDSMMAGKPVVCAINTPDTLITDHQCGVMVKAGDPKEIANAFLNLRDSSAQQLQIMGDNGKKAVLEQYNYTSLALRFEQLFTAETN